MKGEEFVQDDDSRLWKEGVQKYTASCLEEVFEENTVGSLYDKQREEGTEVFDPVNKPVGYNSHPSGIQCIEVTQHMNFCLGNAIKYLWRAGIKDPNKTKEDLKKAIWYINKEIERLDKEFRK